MAQEQDVQMVPICENRNGNYTVNSTYGNNLGAILSPIPGNIGINGFYNASVGRDPDRANVIALCRADILQQSCRDCIQERTASLPRSCPNQRQSVEWSELCMLRYSDQTMLGTLAMVPVLMMWNPQNATSRTQFMASLNRLVRNLSDQAAGSGSLRKVGAGSATGPDSQDIHALVQCTPDLSSDECRICLTEGISALPRCCNGSIGGRVITPSCNIRYETRLFYNDTRIRELAFVPTPETPSSSPPPGTSGGNNDTTRIIIIVVSIFVGVIAAVIVFILLRKRIKQKQEENHENIDAISGVESLIYTLSTIKDATNDFSDDNKLGEGGFGAVYKGKLANDQEIAVKRLSQDSGQGGQEFKNEVILLAKLQHRNLVRLLGFCLEGAEKLLIYEFVQNASLDQFIFDTIKRSVLDWEKRYKIIVGIARGVLYLHEDSRVRIIHRDLKPSNVLLDGAMNPKIADFGMARLFGQDDTQGNTNKISGTFGYMAPEYAMHGQFSIKSDVFSFGVLVLEIISGQKNNNVRRGEITEDLLSFAWKNWNRRTPAEILDPSLRSGSVSMSDMMRCIHIGLLCVQENAADRPTMTAVVLMLNSVSLTLATPTEPAFFMPSENNSRWSDNKNSSNSNVQTQSDTSSRNEASISELYPR